MDSLSQLSMSSRAAQETFIIEIIITSYLNVILITSYHTILIKIPPITTIKFVLASYIKLYIQDIYYMHTWIYSYIYIYVQLAIATLEKYKLI